MTCTVQIRHATVSGEHKTEIQRIRELEPTSMIWGSLCDSIVSGEFHRLARSCGARSASHFMHFIDWTLDIKGTFILDYGARDEKGKKGRVNAQKRIKLWEEAQVVRVIFQTTSILCTSQFCIGTYSSGKKT